MRIDHPVTIPLEKTDLHYPSDAWINWVTEKLVEWFEGKFPLLNVEPSMVQVTDCNFEMGCVFSAYNLKVSFKGKNYRFSADTARGTLIGQGWSPNYEQMIPIVRTVAKAVFDQMSCEGKPVLKEQFTTSKASRVLREKDDPILEQLGIPRGGFGYEVHFSMGPVGYGVRTNSEVTLFHNFSATKWEDRPPPGGVFSMHIAKPIAKINSGDVWTVE